MTISLVVKGYIILSSDSLENAADLKLLQQNEISSAAAVAQYSTVHYSTAQYSTAHYSTVAQEQF